MKVLVACEESQRVCTAFRLRGHEAYSCDIQECSGGHPEWHISEDALKVVGGGVIRTDDWQLHEVGKWDLMIAHPPCTYLTFAANRHLSIRVTDEKKVIDRLWKLAEASTFFMQLALADIPRIAVENPLGYMSRFYRPPDQIIEPYMFAENEFDRENYHCKRTCLWLKNLPLLKTNELHRPAPYAGTRIQTTTKKIKANTWTERAASGKDKSKLRSKTFPGIAQAMAEQWGG